MMKDWCEAETSTADAVVYQVLVAGSLHTTGCLSAARCSAAQVRYIVDFYNASPLPDGPVAMHLDARPALDSFGALADRLRLQAKYFASGNWRRG